ncbi:sensor histidine kinase [Myroides injenensis]|uniref:sensor histidine kinase n=1 Tax=Myroides injenensis TaxID=1183151 RepID=UPI0022710054|nr:histidine kinase [Myroides injenensis]
MKQHKKKEESLFIKHYRIIVIPLVLILYLFSHYILNPYDENWYRMDDEPLWEAILFILIYCTIITEVSLWLSRFLNRILPWDKSAVRRAIIQLFLLILFIFFFYFLINFIYILFLPCGPNEEIALEDKIDLWQSLLISINTGIFISVIHTGYFLLTNWRNSMMDAAELKLRAEKLERIATQAELESLKMQLDPHFLFNNFSTLSELVIEDQKLAVKFIDHLAMVYRYMIANIRKDTICLRDEIKFVQSYFYLIQERMGSKVILNINILPKVEEFFYIAPISLQLLVENAVKHNSASKDSPLIIEIYLEGDYVVVSNNIQQLVVEIPSSKVGITNIIERYRLLSKKNVIVERTQRNFVVKLPLLENKVN